MTTWSLCVVQRMRKPQRSLQQLHGELPVNRVRNIADLAKFSFLDISLASYSFSPWFQILISAPLKLRPYGAIEIRLLLLFLDRSILPLFVLNMTIITHYNHMLYPVILAYIFSNCWPIFNSKFSHLRTQQWLRNVLIIKDPTTP